MQTQLLSVWGTVGSVVLAIFILLAMITVHEFGHYVAGKILKFKIDEFSIGFGPALFKVRRKKSGELFAVRLLPLGGFCSFHGEGTVDDRQPKRKRKKKKDESAASAEKTEGKTTPEPVFEAAFEQPAPALDPASAPELPVPEATSPEPKKRDWNDDGTFDHMKPWKRLIVLVAGAFMNYIFALFLILLSFGIYGQDVVAVGGVAEDEAYPAEYSLQEGDILLKANGRNLLLTTDLARAINKCKTGDRIEFVVSRIREDGTRGVENISVMMRGEVNLKNSTDFTGVWSALGIGIETREDGRYYMVSSASYRFGFFETIGRSFLYSFRLAGSIFRVLGELFTGRLGLSALGGPVTTIKTTATVAAQSFHSFLEIAGFIGVNLAVFNLLPVPALDGSKVVFTAIEWVRGRPISRKVEAIIHAVGFVLLIGFAILVDLLQLL